MKNFVARDGCRSEGCGNAAGRTMDPCWNVATKKCPRFVLFSRRREIVHMLRADFVQDHRAVRFRVVHLQCSTLHKASKTAVDVSRQKLLQRWAVNYTNKKWTVNCKKFRPPSLVIMGIKSRP